MYYYTRLFSNRAVPGTVWNWRAGLGLGRLDRDDLELARELGLLVEDAHNCVLSDFERDGQTASRAIMCSILHAKLGSESFSFIHSRNLRIHHQNRIHGFSHNTGAKCDLHDRNYNRPKLACVHNTAKPSGPGDRIANTYQFHQGLPAEYLQCPPPASLCCNRTLLAHY